MIKRFSVLVLAFCLLFLSYPAHVSAQEPEPTATPTPAYIQQVNLSSGNTLVIERRITYGEISVTVAIMLLIVLFVVYAIVRVNRLWFR